uniref:Uncharacterized protein n=1 Tax=Candidatus Kentrum sp. MB TaxID=2138164 RepID=A0A450XJD7_9GAMM|nr:MAG: hypothetical protein BECKMB1821G_GA0114241_102324 [Candidatus Kentron sp. MB]VFK29278.1 MAG: hypothetical protein BECKMB1821I_GA0114274_100911 [Candidatus Kentron sp. MB]VFK74726.1 MAG: hypothetical protein BECKMB1821H_GA0114242_100911 [Candidatus Kentron sp. MB]
MTIYRRAYFRPGYDIPDDSARNTHCGEFGRVDKRLWRASGLYAFPRTAWERENKRLWRASAGFLVDAAFGLIHPCIYYNYSRSGHKTTDVFFGVIID